MYVSVANDVKNMIYAKLALTRVSYMMKDESIPYCILGKHTNFLRVQEIFPSIKELVVRDAYNIPSLDIDFIVWNVFLP